jgi:hypothetical protein
MSKRAKHSRNRSPGKILAIPAAIAAVSIVGLVSALAGDGLSDILSWVALAIPVATIVWAIRKRRC